MWEKKEEGERVRSGSVRFRIDTVRIDTVRIEPVRIDTVRIDTARIDTVRINTIPYRDGQNGSEGLKGMVLNPSGDLGDRGVLHATCEGDVGEGGVPPGGKAETWGEVAGVRLQEGGLTHTGDATQAQLRVDKGLTNKVRSV